MGALELDPNTAVRADMLSRYATFEGGGGVPRSFGLP
jgi:hypothetical protein